MQQYLYAVVERLPARWRPPSSGIGAGAVVARAVDDLTVITSAVETLPRSGPRSWALHHDVVTTTIDADAVLPFRFGTVVPSDELETWFGAHRRLVQGSLAQLRGCVEMNVKLLRLDSGPDTPVNGSRRDRRPADSPRASIRTLAERLVDRAGLERWRFRFVESRSNVAASVAFLVPRADVASFLTRITPIASHAVSVAIVPTGPWPAYSFAPSFDRPASLTDVAPEPRERPIERRAG